MPNYDYMRKDWEREIYKRCDKEDRTLWLGNQAKKEIEKELNRGQAGDAINFPLSGHVSQSCGGNPSAPAINKQGGEESLTPINLKEEGTFSHNDTPKGGRADSTPCPNCERLRADLDRISEALERALEAMK